MSGHLESIAIFVRNSMYAGMIWIFMTFYASLFNMQLSFDAATSGSMYQISLENLLPSGGIYLGLSVLLHRWIYKQYSKNRSAVKPIVFHFQSCVLVYVMIVIALVHFGLEGVNGFNWNVMIFSVLTIASNLIAIESIGQKRTTNDDQGLLQ